MALPTGWCPRKLAVVFVRLVDRSFSASARRFFLGPREHHPTYKEIVRFIRRFSLGDVPHTKLQLAVKENRPVTVG